ncbi:MAG: hypothetical protein HPY89_11160 [Pelotomaculum sp.]|nr:hypothetical protein [Pelotomaculum sp.]
MILTGLMYAVFILLPGYVAYAAAGYSVDEKGSFARIIYRGVAVFFVVNALAVICTGTPAAKAYWELLRSTPENMDNLVFIGTVTIYVFGGFTLGWLQLYLEYKTLWSAKKEIKGWLSRGTAVLEVMPGNSLKRIFTCYRLANKKPFVSIYFDKDKCIEGEVLKYCWNGREELLLRHADTCDLLVVDLSKCSMVKFKNIHELGDSFKFKKKEITYLDLIHPGLSELIKEKTES